MVLPDAALGGRHHEHVPVAADALPGGRLGQVVVAVPAWLLSRIRDELEDVPRLRRETQPPMPPCERTLCRTDTQNVFLCRGAGVRSWRKSRADARVCVERLR